MRWLMWLHVQMVVVLLGLPFVLLVALVYWRKLVYGFSWFNPDDEAALMQCVSIALFTSGSLLTLKSRWFGQLISWMLHGHYER